MTVFPPRIRPRKGRPSIPAQDHLLVVTVRLTTAQKEKLARIGGAQRLREWLDRVKED